jgi:hypothetical protein
MMTLATTAKTDSNDVDAHIGGVDGFRCVRR